MFHPLLEDLSKFKDAEIDTKIIDLNKKYYMAARMGQGAAAQQIALVLDAYRSEQARRNFEASQKALKMQNKGIDDLINVN